MSRFRAHVFLRSPRLFRCILATFALFFLCVFVMGNLIFVFIPFLPDMTCPVKALQPCLLSISASRYAPRCSALLDTISRSSLWTQAGHPIVSNISSCSESFVSGILDAFGLWPSSLSLEHASPARWMQKPSVVAATFGLKGNRHSICRDLVQHAFSSKQNFVVFLKSDSNSHHDCSSFGYGKCSLCCRNESRLSSRQAGDLLHMWMVHQNNGFLVPFLDWSVDREIVAQICAETSVLQIVLLVFSFHHLQQGALQDSRSPTYMQPSLPQPLKSVNVDSHFHGTLLHTMLGGMNENIEPHSNFQTFPVSVHMNVCVSASSAVLRSISDAMRHKSPVLCLPSAACFCPRPLLYKAGACVPANSAFAGLFDCVDSDCILHNRLTNQTYNDGDTSIDRFARAYAARLTTFAAFYGAPRHVLDIGCGSGCWSLLLAGPFLHVTVLVFDPILAKAAIDMVKTSGNQEFVHIILSEASASTPSATELLLPLTLHSPLNNSDFFGFEFLVLLDVFQVLSFAAVREMTSALQPLMHARSKAFVSVSGIASNRGEWYEPDRLEAAMTALHAAVLWCGVVSGAAETKEFACQGCSLMELLLVGTCKVRPEPPHSWLTSDFAPMRIHESRRTCGNNSYVQELILRQELMRMQSLEDHEIFDSFQAWAHVNPGPETAMFGADFDGRLLVLPNFLQAVNIRDAKQVVLCLHMDASRIKHLDIIARSWDGPISVAILVHHHSFHSVIDLALQAHRSNEAVRRWCSIHLVRFAHSPEHYAVNSFRNIAALFASSLWIICIDADFIPINGTRIVLQRAIESHGYGPHGKQLKRAFIVSVFSSLDTLTEPVDFAMIDSNLEDDLEHKFHSFPLPNGVEEKGERSHQSHGGSDLQKWREYTRNNKGIFQIAFSHSMEPYYVIPMHSWATILYDERFRRWGGDKQSHSHELASASYQFFVVPGAAIVHQPHEVAKYAWSMDKNIAYKCDVLSLVFAKEDTLLFPAEYTTVANSSCPKQVGVEYAQARSSTLSVAKYHDRMEFYYGQIQRCRDAYAPYYLHRPLPGASSQEHTGVSCTSLVQCH